MFRSFFSFIRKSRGECVAALLFLICSGFSGLHAQSNTNARWYTNGNIVSEIPFSELEKKGIYFFDRLFPPEAPPSGISNTREFLESLAMSSNVALLRAMSEKLNLPTNFSPADIPLAQSNILKALAPQEKAGSGLKAGVLIDQKLTSGALLKNADSLESVEIKLGDKTEHLVHIRGAVELILQGNTVHATSITINSESRDLFATGGVSMNGSEIDLVGERLLFNLSNQSGYLFNARGKFQLFRFTSEVFKINKPTYFSIERGTLTLDTNQQPHYLIRMSHFDNFSKDAYIVQNLSFFVHNQPFFYFPYFFQDQYGTSVDLKFGNTKHEGWYFLNGIRLGGIPLIGGIGLQVNVFEKLGLYIGLQNENAFPAHNYSAKLALAAYSENAYLGLIDDFNTVFTAPNLEKQYRYRYKGEYRHTFDIIPDPNLQGKITSKLNLNMKVVSDPYFSHNLERTLPIIKLEKFIGSEYVEGRYVQIPSDNQNFQFDYTLGIPGWGLSLSAAWGFAIFEDKSVADLSDNKRWVSYLQTVDAPVIQLNGSGALDPPGTNSDKKFSLNLGYGLSASYRLKDFYDTAPPFSFSYHDNLLRTTLDLSRPIRFEKDAVGNWWKPLDISLTPVGRVGFEKYWGGEDRPDVSARNIRDSRIFFNLGAGFAINFPSAHVKQAWDQSYGFESMLPTASLSANYSIEKEDNLGGNTPTAPTFKTFRTHSAGANFSIGQKGYGLFFIPYLDLAHSFSSDFSLNLLPTINPDGSQQALTLGAERINNWNASYQLGLVYRDLFNFTFSLPISFFNRSTTNFIVESRSKTLSAGFSFGNTNTAPSLFRIDSFSVNARYDLFDEIATYNQDKINFGIEFKMSLLKLFTLTLSTSSLNQNAYLYFPNKAKPYGQTSVDFLSDLSDSLGITDLIETVRTGKASIAGLQRGLFKLQTIGIALTHDLDSWFMELRYDIAPKVLQATGALKGYYFEQNISFQINIKPEYRVKGLDATIPPWKKIFSPPELRDFNPQAK